MLLRSHYFWCENNMNRNRVDSILFVFFCVKLHEQCWIFKRCIVKLDMRFAEFMRYSCSQFITLESLYLPD